MKEQKIERLIRIHLARQLERQAIKDTQVAKQKSEHSKPSDLRREQQMKMGQKYQVGR